MLRPSTQPSWCNPCRNAPIRAMDSGSSAARFMSTPIRRIRSPCCARAATGHAAAAPPMSLMNSRRRIAIVLEEGRQSSQPGHQNRICDGKGRCAFAAKYSCAIVGSGSKPVRLRTSKCFPVYPPKADLHALMSTRPVSTRLDFAIESRVIANWPPNGSTCLRRVHGSRRLIRSPRRPAPAASAAFRGRAPWRS